MIGLKVKHSTLGVGEITAKDDNYVTVAFSSKTTKFLYPDAFERFLVAVDPKEQNKILQSIHEEKLAAEQKKQAEEAAKILAEEQKAKEEDARQKESQIKPKKYSKTAVRSQRVEGKRMTFFVFQGSTFEKEFQGGYIWAPITNKAGTLPHHWTRLLDVRKGDIILHSCDAQIKAISVARDSCYDCLQPKELIVEDLWEKEGRKVDCDYIFIKNPIKTSSFRDEIIRLCSAKYSPFDRYGSGNMGYLYEINRDLARIFVRALVKQNAYLGDVDYISDLLAEENND